MNMLSIFCKVSFSEKKSSRYLNVFLNISMKEILQKKIRQCIHAFIKTNVTNCNVEILKIQFYQFSSFFTFLLAYFVQTCHHYTFLLQIYYIKYLIDMPSITRGKHIVLNYSNKKVLEYRIILFCFYKKEQIGYLT